MICNLILTFLVWISSIIAVFMIGAFIYFLKYDKIKGKSRSCKLGPRCPDAMHVPGYDGNQAVRFYYIPAKSETESQANG